MTVARILVALIQALLRIAADALAHLSLLLAGILVTAAAFIAIASLSGTSALALRRRHRRKQNP